MAKKEPDQPRWFWWAIGLYFIFEYTIIRVAGKDPGDMLHLAFYVSFFAYPLFFFVVFLALPRGLKKDIDTLFYLLLPELLYFPFWLIVSEGIRKLI
ncbi:MAG: hypothetical protein H0Z33_06610 [Bacillaceae bacterium]|nr:hypothetical protein [Bacillaceae bacterium]